MEEKGKADESLMKLEAQIKAVDMVSEEPHGWMSLIDLAERGLAAGSH
jgi:hypothetical protein